MRLMNAEALQALLNSDAVPAWIDGMIHGLPVIPCGNTLSFESLTFARSKPSNGLGHGLLAVNVPDRLAHGSIVSH